MEPDNEIRKQFKSMFDDFKVSAPEDGWDRIEKSLNTAIVVRSPHIGRVWRIVSSVAAVAVLILSSLLFLNNPIDKEETYISEATQTTLQLKQENSESAIHPLSSDKGEAIDDKLFAERRKDENITSDFIFESIEVDVQDVLQKSYVQEIAIEDRADSEIIEEVVNDVFIEEIHLIAQDQNNLLAEHFSEEDDYGLILSMGGKGGLTSFYQTVNTPMTLRSASVASDNQFLEESEKMLFQQNRFIDNIAEMEHDQPISFGVTVSKTVIDGLYMETGLVYSYLYSRSKNSNTVSQNRQTQSLHYLGIPLNLNYNLFSLRKLNVYASLGGMIEKDVYGKFREEGESQSMDDTMKSELLVNETISQRNPQLSVNAGLGLSYPLYNDLKLYGKIGGAYYFDAKNDFKTIYSDSKIVMDLSIGIRYEFK